MEHEKHPAYGEATTTIRLSALLEERAWAIMLDGVVRLGPVPEQCGGVMG